MPSVTEAPVILLIVVTALAAAVLGILLYQLSQRRRSEGEAQTSLAEMRGQLGAITLQSAQQMEALRTHVVQLQNQVTQSLDVTRKAMDDRLDGAARVMQGVSKQLGQLDESSRRMLDIGKDIAGLQNLLRSPKARGGFGELMLGDLLAQIFPAGQYVLQHVFRDGQIVDAAVRFHAGLVPVDAKFPMENFKRLVEAPADDERRAARKLFMRDVKTHVDAIATKYIRPDEGTLDFALMYIPAENVYYEAVIKPEEPGDNTVFSYAISQRVIPVSPNSFYAYLQTILYGLKGLRIEESAREIIDRLSQLHLEMERFAEAFRLVGDHIDNAQKKYEEAQKRLGRVETKLDQIDGLAKGAEKPALPAGE
jgi:DNA recombination protein RmuC